MVMGISVLARRLNHVEMRLVLLVGMLIAFIVFFQCLALPSWRTISLLPVVDKLSISLPLPVQIATRGTTGTDLSNSTIINLVANVTYASNSKEDANEKEADMDPELESDGNVYSKEGSNFEKGEIFYKRFKVENHQGKFHSFTQKRPKYVQDPSEQARKIDKNYKIPLDPSAHTSMVPDNIQGQAGNMQFVSQRIPSKVIQVLDADSNGSRMHGMDEKAELLKTTSSVLNNKSKMASVSARNMLVQRLQPTSITQMTSLLLQSFNSSSFTWQRPKLSSQRDRELLSAKLEIESAPVTSNPLGLYSPVFQDVSKFMRSYELMERRLKVYIYREGEKPIFHQPKMRGLYASEGWFMKLMEGNKRFVTRDPRKAHLFYLPFSSMMLRVNLSGDGKKMEQYLERYVELIAGKYRIWNRTGGADHFLVACHDWASSITRHIMQNCIRALCNANVAKGFKIGKDTTLPVTYIHSMLDPLKGVRGNPPSQRPILAFFAGSMHGYLRPILLKYWENKEPDMKIFGPMPRDVEGKRIYMEYMKSSKYCICARGYEVHTPRIVEAIFSECVPVIISDNYVPPFFEVLKWEAFSVFVPERDIPNLRDILLSIPEEKYLALQLGVKKVQQHFQWNRSAVKYDLFHMILHSVWYNRVSQIRSR